MPSAVGLREVVRGAAFRRLYVTRVAGQLADGVFQAALASYVFFSPERQASAGAAAAAFAVLLLPYSLVGPFAGVLLDQWRRQQVLVVANLARAGLVVGVAALVAGGRAEVFF
nr:MFS transporter [Acidothermales bacterium]